MPRNVLVEQAVDVALERLDAFIEGEKLAALPDAAARAAMDGQLGHGSNSVRLASLFFVFYATVDAAWDCNSIPTGIRGTYGDKRLATQLGLRSITLHNAVTAFGENLGWKGNVTNSRLQNDVRFDGFARALAGLNAEQRKLCADYMAARFAESRKVIAPLPPVADDVLTYARARKLFYSLIAIPSEGNVQQFLIAALLFVHRQRYGYDIRTHHVHASDRFDATAGDIEEMLNGDLVRAYEVTVRPDWKNRVGDFRKKMDGANLRKYTALCINCTKRPIPKKRVCRYFRGMADPHVISALNRKYAELAGQLRKVSADARQLRADMKCVEGAIRLFRADWERDAVMPVRPTKPSRWGQKGVGLRSALDILRHATQPLTTREIAVMTLEMHGLDIPDGRGMDAVNSTICMGLKRRIGKGVVMVGEKPARWALTGREGEPCGGWRNGSG